MTTIRGTTRIVGLLGWPVDHSLSPPMQGAAFAAAGLDWIYVAYPVHPSRLGDAVRGVRALGLAGANVTIPHKQAVMPYLDDVDANARLIGAVNTIQVQDNGRLVGYNTDSDGAFIAIEREKGFSTVGKRVTVLGAGGAARALVFGAAAHRAASVSILNWDPEREMAVQLAQDLQRAYPNLETVGLSLADPRARAAVEHVDLLCQATPLGMKPDDPLPIPIEWVPNAATVFDAVYTPQCEETRFLEACRKQRQCETIPGLEMLLYQGVKGFSLWTGLEPDVAEMRRALRAALQAK